MHPSLATKQAEVQAVCRRYDVVKLDVFGSAARTGRFDASLSDFDFLVTFRGSNVDLGRLLDFHDDLETLLGRPVDLLDHKMIEESRNYIRRDLILNGSEPIYAA